MAPFSQDIQDLIEEVKDLALENLVTQKWKKKEFDYFVEKKIHGTRYLFADERRYGIVWLNVAVFVFLHLVLAYVFFIAFRPEFHKPLIYAWLYLAVSAVGITCGAHRLWAHRAYKAKLPLRIFYMIAQTMAGQNDIYTWARDHRLHHKFSETDADPHNSKRGFFFSHMGWLMTKKHPDVVLKGKTIDSSDLLADPVIRFQRTFYVPMYLFFCFIYPTLFCYYVWNITLFEAFLISSFGRYIISLHTTWFVNSAAHMFGDKPYTLKTGARENPAVSAVTWGSEGFHNYHHAFPWDYAISEFGWSLNPFKTFIEVMAILGLAYDLRRPTRDLVMKSKEKIALRQVQQPPDAYIEPYDY